MEPSEQAQAYYCGYLLAVGLVGGGIFGFFGYLIGRGKGIGGLGFVLGFVLGLIGLIITALIPGTSGGRRLVRRRRLTRPGARVQRFRRPSA